MSWPFLFFAGDRLSSAELASARLDGDVVEIGEAYMPTDAVETRELRAASLRRRVPTTLAVVRESAAWVHGAVSAAPARHTVQRRTSSRVHHSADARLHYSDVPLGAGAAECISGVWVTTPARTLADLVRALHAGDVDERLVDAMRGLHPDAVAEAIDCLERAPFRFKRPALEYLRARTT